MISGCPEVSGIVEAKGCTKLLISPDPSAPCHLEEGVQLLGAVSLSTVSSSGDASIHGHVEHMEETRRPSIRNFVTGLLTALVFRDQEHAHWLQAWTCFRKVAGV